jgi:hypothetical protein
MRGHRRGEGAEDLMPGTGGLRCVGCHSLKDIYGDAEDQDRFA